MNNTDKNNMFVLDENNPLSLYQQIKIHLQKLIQQGVLKVNDMLPSEQQLANNYGVNRLTVRQAISELVSDGLVVRKHGVGTFVAEPRITPSHQRLLSFSQRMTNLGLKPSSEILQAEVVKATYEVSKQLEVEEGTAVFELVRLRLADGQPLTIETAYIPQELCPTLLSEDLTQSLYIILTKKYGIHQHEADQYIKPVLLHEWEADNLNVAEGTPALLIDTVVRDPNGKVVEYTHGIMRGDKTRVFFHVNSVE